MKKLYKISFCVVSVFVIVFSMFPLSAFAITNPIYTSVSYNRPELIGNDFYVELLLYNSSTNVYHSKVVYFNSVPESNFTPDVSFMPEYEVRFFDDHLQIFCSYDSGMNFSYFGVEIFDNNRSPLYWSGQHLSSSSYEETRLNTDYGSGFRCINYHVYGNVGIVSNRLSSVPSGVNTEFIVEFGESASIHNSIISIYQLLVRLGSMNAEYFEDSLEYLNSLQDIVNDIYAQNEITQQNVFDLLSFVRIISADVILIRDDLQKLYDELLDQGQSLDDIYSELYSVNLKLTVVRDAVVQLMNDVMAIREYSEFIWYDTQSISYYCELIYSLLNSGSDKDQPTTQDPTKLDDYYNAENSLVGNGAADVTGAVQVEINNNAMSVIWNIVQQFLDSHGKVIGFVLTILSFGLIALILGR